MGKILELLSEECPVDRVIVKIIKGFAAHGGVLPDFDGQTLEVADSVQIVPVFKDKEFTYAYEVLGIKIPNIDRIFVTIVKGTGSFVDYMAILRDSVEAVGTKNGDEPIAFIEVTKTSDGESRNTSTFQRMTKFVTLLSDCGDVPLFIVYDIQVKENATRSASALYGDRIWATLGVTVIRDGHVVQPILNSLEHLIEVRNTIKPPTYGQRFYLEIRDSVLYINALLTKGENTRICHDPNIGMVAAHVYLARKVFGWTGRIVITNHGVSSLPANCNSKLVRILRNYNAEMEGIDGLSEPNKAMEYYSYDKKGEKHGTIFLATLARNNDNFHIAYENHAGSERGYVVSLPIAGSKKVMPRAVPKKINGIDVRLPDLVMVDKKAKIVHVIEGEQGKKANIRNGLKQLENFAEFTGFLIEDFPGYAVQYPLVTNYGNIKDVEEWAGNPLFMHMDSTGNLFYGKNFPEELKVK